jgi:hypothetical protein
MRLRVATGAALAALAVALPAFAAESASAAPPPPAAAQSAPAAAPAVEVSIKVPSQAELAAMLPATAEQFETGYYCSGPIAVPGTYGNINHCATFAISKDSTGRIVETPDHCRLYQNAGAGVNVNWYREAWTHWDGYIFAQTAYGTTPPGTWTKYCGPALSFWRVQHEGSYVRASVQAAGSSQTAGANADAP